RLFQLIVGLYPINSLRTKCSATLKERLLTRHRLRRESWPWQKVGRCFSTKSTVSVLLLKSNFCVFFKIENIVPLVHLSLLLPMCGYLRQQMPTSGDKWNLSSSVRTFITA